MCSMFGHFMFDVLQNLFLYQRTHLLHVGEVCKNLFIFFTY